MKKYYAQIYIGGQKFISEHTELKNEVFQGILNKNKCLSLKIPLEGGGLLVLGEKNIEEAFFVVRESV